MTINLMNDVKGYMIQKFGKDLTLSLEMESIERSIKSDYKRSSVDYNGIEFSFDRGEIIVKVLIEDRDYKGNMFDLRILDCFE